MSTKYNRNNANTADDYLYNDDYKVDLNGVEQDDREQTKDFEVLPCIVSGLGLTPSAYPSTNVTVAPGKARDKNGRRIQIATSQIVQITDTEGGNNYVILNHKYSTDSPRKAVNTGTEYDTRKYDDFELTVASTYNQDDIVLGNVKVEGSENVLYTEERTPGVAKPIRKEPSPPVPTHLDLETNWDDVFRKTGASAGLVSFRPAYIKAEFGDRGTGTASGITFTKTTNRIGDWTTNEWAGYYLTCSDGNSWKIVSNTVDTLTLESGAVPVSGTFHLGPNAAGYKFIIQTLNADTEEVEGSAEAESESIESPVKMETIWHALMPDIKYRIKVSSKGGWHQDEWSNFCTAEEIIAGGPKEIPDACGDVLDGDLIITAEDDGIRISWAVKTEYQDKVSGFELCWTDDGTTPDFANKNHRKAFTDRNFVVLPAKMSSEGTTVMVKSKMRAVDKAGRHCVTPKTLNDKSAKKYPADLSNIVTDYHNIITHGSFGTLEDFLKQSINIDDGRPKMVSEIESEMADARGTYAMVGARIAAILQGEIDWAYVRIVAKSGGQYTEIQSAVDSVGTNVPHLILIMPDAGYSYDESVEIDNKKIMFLGLGNPRIHGRIYAINSGRILLLEGLTIYEAIDSPNGIVETGLGDLIIRNGAIKNTGTGYGLKLTSGLTGLITFILENTRIKCSGGNSIGVLLKLGSAGDTFKTRISQTQIEADNNAIQYDINLSGSIYLRLFDSTLKTNSAANTIGVSGSTGIPYLYMAHCRYNELPDEANITEDYGTIEEEKISNVKFDAADLEVLL